MAKKSPKKLERAIAQKVEQAVVDAKSQMSKQARFDLKAADYFSTWLKWPKEMFEEVPEYSNKSRVRDAWLNKFYRNEPYLAGLVNSAVQIDRNRGWSLVGGRNQVVRFTSVLHNWQVQPGRASWREGVGAAALGFYTTDIGGLVEVGRQFKNGPMISMYHLDPTRCELSSNIEKPLKYWPKNPGRIGPRAVDLEPWDYMRAASGINIDEGFNSLGWCALSRMVELAITMIAIYRHEQELLFARAPKGLLLLKGITQQTWNNAMEVRDATLEGREQEWFGAVAVLASAGVDDVDAKLVALSQLPEQFDQKVFTDLLIMGYSLCLGYDPREFWPVSSGSFGNVSEAAQQHKSATGKGGKEFILAFQEELQSNLPDTLQFEFQDRDVEGEKAEAELSILKAQVVQALYPEVITKEQALEWLAENGFPHEWSAAEDNIEGTDTDQILQRMMETVEVQRAVQQFPDEPLVIYEWNVRYPSGRIRELSPKNQRTVHPVTKITKIMTRLAKEIEEGNE